MRLTEAVYDLLDKASVDHFAVSLALDLFQHGVGQFVLRLSLGEHVFPPLYQSKLEWRKAGE